jgi:predicted O-methyltransferase YrrM
MADFLSFAPPGHFYSPLPDQALVKRSYDVVVRPDRMELPGIDLRVEQQLALLAELAPLAADFQFPVDRAASHRFYSGNFYFAEGDARIAFAMLRRANPRRIVEIGAGFSSALILDTAERLLPRLTDYVCAEPDPSRLYDLLRSNDAGRLRIVPSFDALPNEVFSALERDDVLFIDSSHVVKFGSDVARLVFEILPRLAPGVLVHFHDIFWPFEYPREWYAQGRAWNEAHFIRAFLMFNTGFVIEYFNHYVASKHREAVERAIPRCLSNPGGSLWLRRAASAANASA